jgi:hypothetical protein
MGDGDMSNPVEEVRDICERLLPEHQRTLLKYAQEAYVAEKMGVNVVAQKLEQGATMTVNDI